MQEKKSPLEILKDMSTGPVDAALAARALQMMQTDFSQLLARNERDEALFYARNAGIAVQGIIEQLRLSGQCNNVRNRHDIVALRLFVDFVMPLTEGIVTGANESPSRPASQETHQ